LSVQTRDILRIGDLSHVRTTAVACASVGRPFDWSGGAGELNLVLGGEVVLGEELG